MTAIVGRDVELASVHAFLASVTEGASALVLEGEAGVGKTTLWTAGMAEAEERGMLILRARPAESETTLSFSAIGDLLDGVLDEALEQLPAGQRRALARALILDEEEGPSPEAHAVGVALLGALRALGERLPTVVAVDDVQWLDAASSAALAFAARRLRGERVGVMLAQRTGLESPVIPELRRSLLPDRFTELEVGPLDAGPLHHVVRAHLGLTLPRPLLAEVHQAAGGNPFYALEIVRTLQRGDVSVKAGQPLPVPDSLHQLVHGRLLALPRDSRDFLLAAAAHAHPTVEITEAASGVSRDAGLTPALDARLVELDGARIRFTHPLLAAGAYDVADPLRRREVHARLAELLEDPEARAWQLASSVEEPDEEAAAVLEEAAQHARMRGAPRPAALLLDRARELTPDDPLERGVRRAVDAAFLHFESGDSSRAEQQLEAVIATLAPGRLRAHAILRLGRVRSFRSQAAAAKLFLQAMDEGGDDVEILAEAHEGFATCLFRLHERLPEAIEHAEVAAKLALERGNEALAAEALGDRALAEMFLGIDARATLDRALALQPAASDRRIVAQPLFCAAACWHFTDESHRARGVLLEMLGLTEEVGDESSRPYVLMLLGEVECALGELDSALERAAEGRELSDQSGQQTLYANHLALVGLVEARRGREKEARAAVSAALELVAETGARHGELLAMGALGHLELSLGAPAQAAAHTASFLDFVRREAIVETGLIEFVVDHVEALLELGRREEASELLEWYEGNARRLERTTALANCLRCRGLLAAQSGAVDEALTRFEEALRLHAQVELPLDRGRTLLALGTAQRRAKRRRESRATLEQALAVFERIGAALWAGRARDELRRISGRAPAPHALTPAEERVAALVAEGKTNREVAATLYLSERTVEGHLSRCFAKLGIHHRTEVARALASLQTQGVPPSNTGDSPVSAESVSP